MAVSYTRINFEDRVDLNPRGYIVTDLNGTRTAEIAKDNSGLITNGTAINAENMNNLDVGIENNANAINAQDQLIIENTKRSLLNTLTLQLLGLVEDQTGTFQQVFYDFTDTNLFTTVNGYYNATQGRIELPVLATNYFDNVE